MKARIEALESFRESATTTQLPLSDTNSSEVNPLRTPNRFYYQPMPSPTISSPSRFRSYDSQDRNSSTKSTPPMSTSNPSHSEQTGAPVASSTNGALAFRSHHDRSDHYMWDLTQALDNEFDVGDIEESQDAKYHNIPELPPSDLIDEFTVDMTLHDEVQDGKTALHIAAEKGNTSTVQFLLNLQPDMLAQDAMGRTALHLAVYNQHHDVMHELLLKHHLISLEVPDWTGQTALHVAAAHGYEVALSSLLAAGADLERKDSKGQTAFHLAAANGRDKVLELLFSRGADINAKVKL